MKMKRYIAAGILATALLAAGCGKFVRDELITMQNEIDQLTQKVDTMMTKDLAALRSVVTELVNGGYITEVEPIVGEDGREGYRIQFNGERLPIELYQGADGQDGQDAAGPDLTVRQNEEDGRWYWWIKGAEDEDWKLVTDSEGKPMLVDGKDGKTPTLKVEEGYWFLSWDGGETWEETGWKAKGEDAFEIFSAIQPYDDRLELTLASDGSVLVLPIYQPVAFDLTLEGQDLDKKVLIVPGDTLSIRYAVTGTGAEKALLVAGTDGRFKTAIRQESATEGFVDVICPDPFPTGGYIYVTVNDGNGRSLARVIRFAVPGIQLEEKDLLYEAGAAADTVKVTFKTDEEANDFEVEAQAVFPEGVDPWLTVTMNAEEKTLTYNIDENTAADKRTCVIKVYPKEYADLVKEITVTQAGVTAPATGE